MARVVIVGSEISTAVAIVNTSTTPFSFVSFDPGLGAGCRVAIDGVNAGVGSVLTGEVCLIDVTDPAHPVKLGSIDTHLSGIGAIAVHGSFVAVGEGTNMFQARVALIDFSVPGTPVLHGPVPTPLVGIEMPKDPKDPNSMNQPLQAIGSVAFFSPTTVVVSGPGSWEAYFIDFSAASPAANQVNSAVSGGLTLDAEADAAQWVAGDANSGIVKLFSGATNTQLGKVTTTIAGFNSISLGGAKAFGGSQLGGTVALIDFTATPIGVTTFNSQLSGATVVMERTTGVCAELIGGRITLFDLTHSPPSSLGTIDVSNMVSVLSTVGISTPPQVKVDPPAVMFGPVMIGMPSAMTAGAVTVGNSGAHPLVISNLAISAATAAMAAQFTFTPPGPLTIAPGATAVLRTVFTPAVLGSASAVLSFDTNDPTRPHVTVPLSGTGAAPRLSAPTGPIAAGTVAVCQSGAAPAFALENLGAVPLTITALTTTAPFSITLPPATSPPTLPLVIPAMQSIQVVVAFTPTGVGAVAGTLTITSNDGGVAGTTTVLALSGTGTPMPPPAMSVSTTALSFGAVPAQFFIALRFTISNTGPCADLIVSLDSSGAPFFVANAAATSVSPTDTHLGNQTIQGGRSRQFLVLFAPTSTGAAAGTLTITSNVPGAMPTTIALSGSGVVLSPAAFELVLDRSGSMQGSAPGGTKMTALKAAVKLFAELLIPGQGDEMGSVAFDDQLQVLTPFAAFDTTQQSAIETDAGGLQPRNATSIGGGLQLGQAQLAGSTLGRKILLVFTDGMENTPPMIATVEPGILSAGTEVYAIGLGQPQNISTAALGALAATAGGKFFLTDDTLVLRKNFVQVLADAFRSNMAADPPFTLMPGQSTTISVTASACDRRLSFILNWDNPQSQLALRVQAPNGTIFSASSPASNLLVRYVQGTGYIVCTLSLPPLDPGSGLVVGPNPGGQWAMIVDALNVPAGGERCTTSLMVEGRLDLQVALKGTDASAPVRLAATLQQDGVPVTGASIQVKVTAPTRSLAAASTAAVVRRALQADKNPIASGGRPLIQTRTSVYSLQYSAATGSYVLNLPAPQIDGAYGFEFLATGDACGGPFQRYASYSLFLGKRVVSGNTGVTVTVSPPNTVVVTVTPGGQVGLVGPGQAHLIRPIVTGGIASRVIDLGDGRYAFRVKWNPLKAPPRIKVRVGGVAVKVPRVKTTPPKRRAGRRRSRGSRGRH